MLRAILSPRWPRLSSFLPLLALCILVVTVAQADDPLFEPGPVYPVGGSGTNIATADMSGDGLPDAVVCDPNGQKVAVWQGSSDGTFILLGELPALGRPISFDVFDMNGDGFPDVAACIQFQLNVQVFVNNQSGGLVPFGTVPTPAGPYSVAHGDFNHDGIQDLVVGCSASNSLVQFYRGLGDGTFDTTGPVFGIGDRMSGHNLEVADFNLDGHPDAATATTNGRSVQVLFGDGAFSFILGPSYSPPTLYALNTIHQGDFNGDGLVDLFSANNNSHGYAIFLNQPETPGTFTVDDWIVPNWSLPWMGAVSDYDSDGDLDVAVGDYGTHQIYVLAGDGMGTFTVLPTTYPMTGAAAPVVGDFKHDGLPDLAVACTNGTMGMLYGWRPEPGPEPCFTFDGSDHGLACVQDGEGATYCYIPVPQGTLQDGQSFSYSFAATDCSVPGDFGAYTLMGLCGQPSAAGTGYFLGLDINYDDRNCYRARIRAHTSDGAISVGDFIQLMPGVSYECRITYSAGNAHVQILDPAVGPIGEDDIAHNPEQYSTFLLMKDYYTGDPGWAVWNQSAGRVDFHTSRAGGYYLDGWADDVYLPGCSQPLPPCYTFDSSDHGLSCTQDAEGALYCFIPVTPDILEDGGLFSFRFNATACNAPGYYGAYTLVGLSGQPGPQGQGYFLGLDIVYDDLQCYQARLRRVTSGGSIQVGNLLPLAAGATYRFTVTYFGGYARLQILDQGGSVVGEDQISHVPEQYSNFLLLKDYYTGDPGYAIWNQAEGRVDFRSSRAGNYYLEGWIDDISSPGCMESLGLCYTFQYWDHKLRRDQDVEGAGYWVIPTESGQLEDGQQVSFEFGQTSCAVPGAWGAYSLAGIAGEHGQTQFAGAELLYDDSECCRVRLRTITDNDISVAQSRPIALGERYRGLLTYSAGMIRLQVFTQARVPAYDDSLPYSPRTCSTFLLAKDYYTGGGGYGRWDPTDQRFEYLVDRQDGYSLEGWVDNISVPWCAYPSGTEEPRPESLFEKGLRVAPNPFSAGTRIDFNLNAAGLVEMAVYDAGGRVVRSLHRGGMTAGFHSMTWDGRGDGGQRLASGVYFVRMHGRDGIRSERLIHLR